MGSVITPIIFPYFDGERKTSPTSLHYFRMGIIEEISFFFFDVEDPIRNQNFVQK